VVLEPLLPEQCPPAPPPPIRLKFTCISAHAVCTCVRQEVHQPDPAGVIVHQRRLVGVYEAVPRQRGDGLLRVLEGHTQRAAGAGSGDLRFGMGHTGLNGAIAEGSLGRG